MKLIAGIFCSELRKVVADRGLENFGDQVLHGADHGDDARGFGVRTWNLDLQDQF